VDANAVLLFTVPSRDVEDEFTCHRNNRLFSLGRSDSPKVISNSLILHLI
jgi:hypothetical protein